jgi:hypothetical protein
MRENYWGRTAMKKYEYQSFDVGKTPGFGKK